MIYLDMDGVIADFTTQALRVFQSTIPLSSITTFEIWDHLGVSKEEFWRRIDEHEARFWRTIPKYSFTDNIIALLGDYTILTFPTNNPHSTTGKHEWIHTHIGKDVDFAMIKNKSRLAKSSADLLIDDNEKNVDEWESKGGSAILFPQPWNRNRQYDSDDAKFGYLVNAFDRWHSAHNHRL